jgi:hypothetical protein
MKHTVYLPSAVTWRCEKRRKPVKPIYSALRALAALEQVELIGDEQEQRASLEYLQSVLHEYKDV